jgi:hypothetical protein
MHVSSERDMYVPHPALHVHAAPPPSPSPQTLIIQPGRLLDGARYAPRVVLVLLVGSEDCASRHMLNRNGMPEK